MAASITTEIRARNTAPAGPSVSLGCQSWSDPAAPSDELLEVAGHELLGVAIFVADLVIWPDVRKLAPAGGQRHLAQVVAVVLDAFEDPHSLLQLDTFAETVAAAEYAPQGGRVPLPTGPASPCLDFGHRAVDSTSRHPV